MMPKAIRILTKMAIAVSALWFFVGVVALAQAYLRDIAPMQDYLNIFGMFVALPALLFGVAWALLRRFQ